MKKLIGLAKQAGAESPAGMISEAARLVESALAGVLEFYEKDGSIVLSVGSMFVTVEVMRAWKNLSLTPTPLPLGEARRGEGRK